MKHITAVAFVVLCVVLRGSCLFAAEPSAIDFSRDIRPILSDYCFQCHGPDADARQAELRLDSETDSHADRNGYRVITPGHADESELIRRVLSPDPDDVMPPPTTKRQLSARQVELLRNWIDSGGKYDGHWAWKPLTRPVVPVVESQSAADQRWPKNPIDHFVIQRLHDAGLTWSAEADRSTLIRRLTLDLIGLPPTPDEVGAFTADDAPDAYERVVDRLLKSPHFGERMAIDWLDAARYADTNGYQVDRDREMYPWRDWVIAAFNDNKPFDVFTIEQIAGDLLPNATVEQKIATGFHRNHMMNEEGGIIPEEFLAEYCADRVETTATVWLGQTFTCTRCHDHKFDPFTQRDYYGLYAFFHNITEQGVGQYGVNIRRNNPPQLQIPSPELELRKADLTRQLGMLQQTLDSAPESAGETPELKEKIKSLRKQLETTDLEIPTTLVMQEMDKPRETFVLLRGAYDRPGERVFPATPAILPPMSSDLPHNRLGLARWLVDEANPLTARVTVNRLWQSMFGTGLVSSAEDFGSQGAFPSHPRLLDWLATEFMSSGWDVKATIRLILTSAAYRQDSRRNAELNERDPGNRLLWRGPRFRLPAELIRDQALAVSGLLVNTIGGPSVKPYHPPGLYEQVVSGSSADTYVQDHGDSLYRRSLYTYWKRSVPNPAMLAFDAPFRETCVVQRSRTNTPMQALNLMNDPTFVEAAKFLACRAVSEGGPGDEAQIRYGFQLVTARRPRQQELSILVAALNRARDDFHADPHAAESLLKTGETSVGCDADAVELAAFTTVMSTILNLDEAVTKE